MVAFGLFDTVCAGLPRVRWAPHEYAGRTICLVDRIGRRSGKVITIPLMYVPDDDAFYRVAAQGVAEQHPVWYYNLIESRTVTFQVQGRKGVMGVEMVSTEARPRVWDRCVECDPGYALYQARTERKMPVLICASP